MEHPHFMGDDQIIQDLWLTYGTFTSYGRHAEHSRFTVDVQGTPSPWKMVRTPKPTKHRQQLPKHDWN